MDKKTQALKLALEALEHEAEIGNDDAYRRERDAIREALAYSALDRMAENARNLGLDYAPIVERVENSVGMGHGAWDMVEPKELAKGFHEAFAEPPCKTGSQCTSKCSQCEQPAQQPPTVAELLCVCGAEWEWRNRDWELVATAKPAQQQEPATVVGAIPMGHNQKDMPFAHVDHLPVGTKLYTSPPASKPWVGLTDEEWQEIDASLNGKRDLARIFTRAIEAKLKEKNNG